MDGTSMILGARCTNGENSVFSMNPHTCDTPINLFVKHGFYWISQVIVMVHYINY